jgi:hypothetical protein
LLNEKNTLINLLKMKNKINLYTTPSFSLPHRLAFMNEFEGQTHIENNEGGKAENSPQPMTWEAMDKKVNAVKAGTESVIGKYKNVDANAIEQRLRAEAGLAKPSSQDTLQNSPPMTERTLKMRLSTEMKNALGGKWAPQGDVTDAMNKAIQKDSNLLAKLGNMNPGDVYREIRQIAGTYVAEKAKAARPTIKSRPAKYVMRKGRMVLDQSAQRAAGVRNKKLIFPRKR